MGLAYLFRFRGGWPRGRSGDARARPASGAGAIHDFSALAAPISGLANSGRPGADDAGLSASFAGGGRAGRLSPLLDASVGHIAHHGEEVEIHRRALSEEISRRDRGAISLTVQWLRGAIAVGWMLGAVYFLFGYLLAKSNGAPAFLGFPLEDAKRLSFLLATVGAAGAAAVALAGGWLIATGMTENDRLRRRGGELGAKLAELAVDFDRQLGGYREKIVDRNAAADILLEDVSRAHLVALEAKLLFSRVNFLTLIDARAAEGQFKRFLAPGGDAGPSGGEAFIGMLAALAVGLFAGHQLFSPNAGLILKTLAGALAPAMQQYPALLSAFIASVLAFATVGGVVRLFSTIFVGSSAVSKGRALALDSVRSAFVAAKAPRPDDVILQVEDIVEILRARLFSGASSRLDGAHRVNDTSDLAPGGAIRADAADAESPAWRRPKEGPRFVETRFAAAPQTWRTDAGARQAGQDGAGPSTTKRPLFSPKTDG